MKRKRKPRSYKISDKDYKAAMAAAKKKGQSLATVIEQFVIEYGNHKQKKCQNKGTIMYPTK